MPFFMDIHRGLDGASPEDVLKAHDEDLAVQGKYNVLYHKYWYDPEKGTVFCFMEAPDSEACHAVHREAHGLPADEIIEVQRELVDAFLGEGRESPKGTALRPDGSLDPAFRVILITQVANFPHVAKRWGDEVAGRVVRNHDEVVREALERCGGREIQRIRDGLMASFSRPSQALWCAVSIQEAGAQLPDDGTVPRPEIGIGVSAGQPVGRHDDLFGLAVHLAQELSLKAEPGQILTSEGVRELCLGEAFQFLDHGPVSVRGADGPVRHYGLKWSAEADEAACSGETGGGVAVGTGASAEFTGERGGRLRSLWERVVGLAQELRRRHVFRVGAIYLAVSFVVLQVADLTFEPLLLPSWTYTLILLLTILGFPLVLVLAWVFQLTAGGVKRDLGEG
jgi:class 3 adenylate cyclase